MESYILMGFRGGSNDDVIPQEHLITSPEAKIHPSNKKLRQLRCSMGLENLLLLRSALTGFAWNDKRSRE